MRVLSVAWECPLEPYGGLGVFTSRLLPEMARRHEVVHYCLHSFNSPVKPVDYHGVKVIRLREPLIDSTGGVLVLSAVYLGDALMHVLPLFDAVFAQDVHTGLVVACAKELGVKSLYYVHTWSYNPIDILGALVSDALFANGKFTASQIMSMVGREAKVVYPASPYPPVDRPSKGVSSETPVVLIPSRWQFNKDPTHVIKALEEARRRVKFEVIVFGRGAELYKLPEWIRNAGTVSEEEKLRLYRSASLVLQVGFPEPFGLVALEAVSQGTPVLVSNQSGVADVLPSEAVYSLDNLADKLVQLLSSKSMREELWYKERESWIMKRTWSDVWREIEEEMVR